MAPRGRSLGPSGTALMRTVRAQVAAGWKPGLTVLTGDDLYHLDAAQRLLLAHLVPEQESEFALSVFGEREGRVDVAELLAAARSKPMFASRRVVLVRDGQALDGEEAALEAYAARPPADSFLVVRVPKLDLRRGLHKALAGAGRLLEFRSTQTDPEYRDEITALARERGLTLDQAVASFLVDASGRDLYRVASELDKIRAWLGPRAQSVSWEQFREVAAMGGLLTGWEVADALMERSADKAVAALRTLLEGGEEPIRILGGLAYRARTLLQAKAMAAAGAPRREITTALRSWAYDEALHAGLDRYSLAELMRFPGRLLAADRCLKSRSLDARAVLEEAVRELTGTDGKRVGEEA